MFDFIKKKNSSHLEKSKEISSHLQHEKVNAAVSLLAKGKAYTNCPDDKSSEAIKCYLEAAKIYGTIGNKLEREEKP